MQALTILYGLIISTVIVSVLAFNDYSKLLRLQFSAYSFFNRKEYYRIFTYGFVHADWTHLFINMFVLHSFGSSVILLSEYYFNYPLLFFITLYIGGIIISPIYSLFKHKDNYHYAAVGASGAVSAVVFASIIMFPSGSIRFFFIPIDIPSYVFGIFYLVYSAYMSKKAKDNIGHDAHFVGAVFGIILPLIFNPNIFNAFLAQIF